MWISIQGYLSWICGYLGSIWDIYMPSIIPQRLATDPSHGRVRWNRRHLCQGVRCRLVWPGQWPVSQGWAPPAPAQERRAPTIGSALSQTSSGPVPAAAFTTLAITDENCALRMLLLLRLGGNRESGLQLPHMQAFMISPPFLSVEILVIGHVPALMRLCGSRPGAAIGPITLSWSSDGRTC